MMGDLSDGTAYNAIARDDHYGPRFLSEFEDRLYLGTDMCFPSMKVELDKLLLHWRQTGKISETTFRKIAWENAEKLLGL
jgi:predicted TIM-barrel fold metal-dependent hydrolase